MRFKARMATEHVQLLHNLIVPISRLTSSSGSGGGDTTIYLDPDHLRISTRGGSDGGGSNTASQALNDHGTSGTEGIACFAELIAPHGIFLDHRIESIANNVIVFEIDLVHLRTALSATLQSMGTGGGGGSVGGSNSAPLHNSNEDATSSSKRRRVSGGSYGSSSRGSSSSYLVVMKLAKRGGLPCLCLDASCANGTLDVHHAVPVRILRADEWQHHLPPVVNTPDVQLEFQLDRPLKPVIERLKSISPIIYVDGSMTGELVLRIDSDAVAIRTFYDKLIPVKVNEDDDSKEDENGNESENAESPARSPYRSRRRSRKIGNTEGEDEQLSKCTLKVDSKKLLAALQWQSSMLRGSVSSYIICMIENEMMVVHVVLNPDDVGFFTYYIPVHYLNPDMMDL